MSPTFPTRWQKTIHCLVCNTANLFTAREHSNGGIYFNVDPNRAKCRICGTKLDTSSLPYPWRDVPEPW